MQEVSRLYNEIYESQNYYVETSLIAGDKGVLITEDAERILFGGTAIIVGSSHPDSGYGETIINSIRTTRRVFSNSKPEVGCCPSGEIYVEMHRPRGNIERMGTLIPYIRLVSNEDGRYTEWLRKGVYFIDTRDNTHNDDDLDIISIHGYDAMMKSEVPYGSFYTEIDFTLTNTSETPDTVLGDWTKSNGVYSATFRDNRIQNNKTISIVYSDDDSKVFGQTVSSTQLAGGVRFESRTMPPENFFGKVVLHEANTISFPARDIDVVRDIASKMQVHLDMRSDETHKSVVEYINKGYIIQYPAEYTMRETLSFIAAMYAGNWIINDAGDLQFIGIYDLPEETNLLTNELGRRITFGNEKTRILV